MKPAMVMAMAIATSSKMPHDDKYIEAVFYVNDGDGEYKTNDGDYMEIGADNYEKDD